MNERGIMVGVGVESESEYVVVDDVGHVHVFGVGLDDEREVVVRVRW